MHSLQPLLIDMGVNLCRRYVRVAQHLLDDSQVSAIAEQVRGETMTEQVRVDICLQARMSRERFHDLPNADSRKFRSPARQKNFAPAATLYQFRPFG